MPRFHPIFTEEELQNEEWRDVVGYEGYYSISNLGRVRRDKTNASTHSGRFLSLTINGKGYVTVKLHADPLPAKRKRVHKLVAEAFLGVCPTGMEVNHKNPNGDKTNNRLDNLEYVTHIQNIRHAINTLNNFNSSRARGDKNGSRKHLEKVPRGDNHYARKFPHKVACGESCGQSKLTENDVRAIRILANQKITHTQIAKMYNVSPPTIKRIIIHRTWRHIT